MHKPQKRTISSFALIYVEISMPTQSREGHWRFQGGGGDGLKSCSLSMKAQLTLNWIL